MALRTWEIEFVKISGPGPDKWRCEMTAPGKTYRESKENAVESAISIGRIASGIYQPGSHWHYTATPVLWGKYKGEMFQ